MTTKRFDRYLKSIAAIAAISLSMISILMPPATIAATLSSQLSEMESIAFGQSSSGTDEERLSALEKKAYGKVRTGDFSERFVLLQHYMGVEPSQSEHSNNSGDSGILSAGTTSVRLPAAVAPDGFASPSAATTASSSAPATGEHRQPLEASVSNRRLKLQAGDDERFGGLWVGTLASKIDPHVKVFCELHGSDDHFTGTMIWTSAICGGCRRTIAGYFNRKDQACMMKDTRVESLNTRVLTKFCMVDQYAFGITENAEQLRGWFHSSQCKDEGAVTLTRYRE